MKKLTKNVSECVTKAIVPRVCVTDRRFPTSRSEISREQLTSARNTDINPPRCARVRSVYVQERAALGQVRVKAK